jgi:phenylpyruvate tautomerase PptA (4-oxalocrotonate tautomerase family)
MPQIEIQLLPPAASDDATLMGRITDLTNDVAGAMA